MLKACKWVIWGALACVMVACEKTGESVPVTLNAPMPVFVYQEGDVFVLKHQKIRLELLPRVGGRISSLKYGTHELLVTRDQHPHIRHHLWGSVLWTSPQSDWNWPPVDVLDHHPYEVTVEADRLVMTSGIDPKTGYQIIKSYAPVPGKDAIRLGYRIYNHNPEPRQLAPWELTRVPPSGLTFFPQGERDTESGIFYPLKLEQQDGIIWFPYEHKHLQNDHHKLMTDSSEGWLAHVSRGYLLVKVFPDIPTHLIANGEGEIEIFVNAEKTYLELQQQGALTTLEPGQYLDWEVIWYVQRLPDAIKAEVGNAQLVGKVRELALSHRP